VGRRFGSSAVKNENKAANRTVKSKTAWIPQAASRLATGVPQRHRFDLTQETRPIKTQDGRPAKNPIACSNHISEPRCEIDVPVILGLPTRWFRLKLSLKPVV
jgi:hypothetical protein